MNTHRADGGGGRMTATLGNGTLHDAATQHEMSVDVAEALRVHAGGESECRHQQETPNRIGAAANGARRDGVHAFP